MWGEEGEEQAAAMRALREAAAPILTREMEHVNSTKKMDMIHNQISDIRKIMEVIRSCVPPVHLYPTPTPLSHYSSVMHCHNI